MTNMMKVVGNHVKKFIPPVLVKVNDHLESVARRLRPALKTRIDLEDTGLSLLVRNSHREAWRTYDGVVEPLEREDEENEGVRIVRKRQRCEGFCQHQD